MGYGSRKRPGPQGPPGTQLSFGSGLPSGGSDGDVYQDTETGITYKNIDGTWEVQFTPISSVQLPDGNYTLGIGGTQNGTMIVSDGKIISAVEAEP